MAEIHGFKRIKKVDIRELRTGAELFRHVKTGAELLSFINEDENKVFGITFRTPPGDSTGVPHILEHAVLCGSRKYPVKEPFVELLKGSLQTFLNAMTYPDKTCYPVASQNLQDFYNLIDVYLDAVFYPRITPFIFQQEGWHFELENPTAPIVYKGVVFNEMKGAYSSPDNLQSEYIQQSLFPDNTYGFDSGGNPSEITKLTFEQFKDFHRKYYHPSNARISFYGDDDPEERLRLVNEYLKAFEREKIESAVLLQAPFDTPKRLSRSFSVSTDREQGRKGMVTLNWLLGETTDQELNISFHVLEYILLGMPGSPLRKALIDSNYGEDLAGGGLGSELRQMYFSTGLKGVDLKQADAVENLILDTLKKLSRDGIGADTVEAAINTIEFGLRENNTGHFPRGLLLMLRALSTWLYDDDPLSLVAFEAPLESLKSRLNDSESHFEGMIDRFFLKNMHRTTLTMKPDPDLASRVEASEKEKLEKERAAMSPAQLEDIAENTKKLKKSQETPDPPEALASIPTLKIADLDKKNKEIPIVDEHEKGAQILFHPLFTNGISYLDLGFDLHNLPQRYLPYVRLFGRALLEMGTKEEDYVALTQRISRKTGGIRSALFSSTAKDSEGGTLWLFLRGKTMQNRSNELFGILRDILMSVQLDNRERFRQMTLEAKARQEQMLVPAGHQVVKMRLSSHFTEADWASEQMQGVSYLFFLRELAKAVDENWPDVLRDLEEMRRILINRNSIIVNVTSNEEGWSLLRPQLMEFLVALPAFTVGRADWSREEPPKFEGLTIPSQVNYVGKGTNLYQLGFPFHGSFQVITRYLRNAWLWDRVRVRGGAYGAFCSFDRLSGTLSFVSYRDPNTMETLEAFDQSARFLKDVDLNKEELSKSVIGTIGDFDQYRLPDAKGYISMVRRLSGETDEDRQRVRDEILNTTPGDFTDFAKILEAVKEKGLIKILGSRSAIKGVLSDRPGWLDVLDVL